ncbi:4a-hydroxytetrahydrobiopterin dehydratase [Arthrobacter celericrescens]|uniref:4a-hydroxytetrahydrobiopterin dehydratase n=1 Tax=Arthrobacter celericrescens TaxID=2320851 RepID=UPI000EA1FC5F|nr:4a-hydroxytetrahydrobiopterin dehydratase [Arthrobacter celericrescens]
MGEAKDILRQSDIDEALPGLPDWEYRSGGLVTVYKLPTSAAALELIAAVGRIAEELNHHPDLDWRYNRVFLLFTSHDAGSRLTARDVLAARRCSEAAAAAGATAQPERFPAG